MNHFKKGAQVIDEKCLCDKSQIPSLATIVYNGLGECELNMCPDGYLDTENNCHKCAGAGHQWTEEVSYNHN